MNKSLKWFGRIVWIGILINLTLAIPAIISPRLLNITLGLGAEASDVWLRNVGMLLISMSMFYAGAARDPLRYPGYSWLVAISRLIAAVFWLYMVRVTIYPTQMRQFLFADLAFGVVEGLLLQVGLPADSKISLPNLKRLWLGLIALLKAKWRLKTVRVGLVVVIVLAGVAGYVLWDRLLRKRPDIVYASQQDHWKHGAIGLSNESRVPYYIWRVLPQMFADKLPGPGWSSFGFIMEPDNELP
ncbi:MAG: hypothetical protein ABJA18_03530, partial [bacterium]